MAAEEVAERKLATILFADLVGSTALGASQDPERTRALLDRFYDAMAAEIDSAGGTVEKFAGDAVMAAFGAPTAHEDDAERALHAALAMRHKLEELFGDSIALRIGVNTGDVVVGRAREGSSFVTGDAVNVAARLEQAAGAGEILVGERTAAAARGAFEFGEPLQVEAKGKPEGVSARQLLRVLTLMRPRGVAGLRAAFVGRERELAAIQEAYLETVESARPRLVTILGAPGVGKTRLVREFWQWLGEQSPEPLRRTGRCLSYGQATTYWPLGEVLREHLGLLESDPPDAQIRKLGDRSILGLTLGLDVASDLHPLAARDRLHRAWVDFCEELAADRPAVLFVEDLHWAEEPLLDLLERLAEDVRGPLLILGTARPELLELRPGWGGRRIAGTLVELEPLSAEESGRLLGELLATELPEQLKSTLLSKAEGNPFFVEELISTLVDRGVLEREDGGWKARELPPGFDVPDTVRSVLAARIDLLGPAEKAALQAAAVMGRVFWSGPLYELLPDLEPDLRVLEERDFIRRRVGSSIAGEQEYAIKHALTAGVAYESLPKAARARLHAEFAAWLERGEEVREQQAALIAHHYAEAVRPEDADLAWANAPDELPRLREKAVAWLRRAADLAVGRYELEEGLSMLHRALELEERREAQAELWRAVGRASAFRYDGQAFWTALQRAIELTSDPAQLGDLYSDLAIETAIRKGMWRRRPAPELVDGWIEQALELTTPDGPGRAKALIARSNWDPWESGEAAQQAGEIAERLGDVELRSLAFDARGIAAAATGEYDLGRAWAERRFEFLPFITDPDHRADIYAAPITACVWLGHFREARRLAAAHDEIAGRLTPHHRMHAVAILMEVEELAGGWEGLRALEERAEQAAADNVSTPCVRNSRALLLGAVERENAGDRAESVRLEEAAEELGMEGFGHVLDTPRLRLALAREDKGRAEEILAEAMVETGWNRGWLWLSTLATRLDALAAVGQRDAVEEDAHARIRRGTYLEPFALRALGLVREDGSMLEEAVAAFDRLGLAWHAEQTRALL